jgi:hypothetical protein
MPGNWSYRAQAFSAGPISALSAPLNFAITGPPTPSALAVATFPVNGGSVARGQNAVLWVYVTNNGPIPLPAGTRVWMLVSGTGFNQWVGSALTQGLAPGASQWYSFSWAVPLAQPTGTHWYWGQVFSPGLGAISGFSPGRSFLITP